MKKEMNAVLWAIGGLFLAISLFSYNSQDPGLFSNTSIFSPINTCGLAGAYLSDMFFALFGISAFLLPFATIKISYDYIKHGSSLLTQIALSTFGFLMAISATLSIHLNNIEFMGETFSAGGILGNFAASLMIAYLNKGGAYLVSVGFFVMMLIFAQRSFSFSLPINKNIVPNFLSKKKPKIFIPALNKQLIRNAEAPTISIRQPQKNSSSKSKSTKPGFKNTVFKLPPIETLTNSLKAEANIDKESLIEKSKQLETILEAYKIEGHVVEVQPGPVVTMYEFEPAFGVKVNQIVNLSGDIAMKLRADSVRIIAPLPGKGAVGIEVPNEERQMVYFKDVYGSDDSFIDKKLPLVLGKNTQGEGVTTDLTKMPHLLIAGTTGSGKSVSVNGMISSLLFTKTPEETRIILIDPKAIEFSFFEDIPHLLFPVITDAAKANNALKWTVYEMERRYRLMQMINVRKIDDFNERVKELTKKEREELHDGWLEKEGLLEQMEEGQNAFAHMPYIVVVIDELADLMLVAAKDVEVSIARLAQKARASGIHLIVATQRPSTDVITGLIKANFPSRIAFRVASKVDSRIILDTGGADMLLGYGDMLFLPPGTSKLNRIHGAFLSDKEVQATTKYWTKQADPDYLSEEAMTHSTNIEKEGDEKVDELFDKAVQIVASSKQASISMLQRKLSIGYNRAAKIIEKMEEHNMVGPADGAKPREVYINSI